MKRARALAAAVLFGIGGMIPAVAQAQNLEAGKSPAQLFSNTCAVCHKSARGLVRSVPPGSLPSFLREHYTTSREMAQQLSGYLLASGGTDTRGRPQEARQAPRGAEPATAPPQQQQQSQPMQEPPQAQQRPPRPVAEEQAPQQRQPESPAAQRAREAEERRAARRELRAKQAQEAAAAAAVEREKNRRNRVTPSRIDAAAAARGKDALPLGDILKNEPPAAASEPAVSPPPEPKPEPSENTARPDPVPQVTPAPPAETPREPSAPEPGPAPEPNGDSTGATPEDGKPPAASGPPPVPPISN